MFFAVDSSITVRKKDENMAIITLTAENFEAEVAQAKGKVMVDFWAPWCGPCQMMGPVIDEISGEITDVKFGKVNIDEQQELAAQFGVMSIPTLLVFEDGKVADTSVGALPKAAVLKLLK